MSTHIPTEAEKIANLHSWGNTPIGRARLTQTVREFHGRGLSVRQISDQLRLPEISVEGLIFQGGAK